MQFSLFYNLIEEIRTEMFTRNVYRVYLSIVEYLQVQRVVMYSGMEYSQALLFFMIQKLWFPRKFSGLTKRLLIENMLLKSI